MFIAGTNFELFFVAAAGHPLKALRNEEFRLYAFIVLAAVIGITASLMKDGGYALMGCGVGSGENRIQDAVKNALESPLLRDYDLTTARSFLINITVGRNAQGVTAKQFGEITSSIQKYTGRANNFKSGLVFDDSQEFGDKVSITVIVTGIKMNILPHHDSENIIVIDDNFVFNREVAQREGIELPDVRSEKIGYNNVSNRKKNIFKDGEKPALLASEYENLSYLENNAAIRRKAGEKKGNR
jgi:cell division protein FtsZ